MVRPHDLATKNEQTDKHSFAKHRTRKTSKTNASEAAKRAAGKIKDHHGLELIGLINDTEKCHIDWHSECGVPVGQSVA